MNQAEANRLADLYNLMLEEAESWEDLKAFRWDNYAGKIYAYTHAARLIERVLNDNGYELS